MMTEEEKKAIVRAGEHLTNPACNYLSDEEIYILLDLIDKQQKEIEEEKEKWKELFHEYNKLVGEVIDKEQDLKDSISKDKLRAEREDILNRVKDPNKRIYKLQVIDKLLEEK